MPNRILCAKLRDFKADIPALKKHFDEHVRKYEPTQYFDNDAQYSGWSVTSRDGTLDDGIKRISEEDRKLKGVDVADSKTPTEICTGVLQKTMEDLSARNINFFRTRLMMLNENFEMNFHRDGNLETWRLHIPIETNPESYFEWKLGDKFTKLHMPADGSAYLVRVDELHRAMNYTQTPTERIHLLMSAKNNFKPSDFDTFYEYKQIIPEISLADGNATQAPQASVSHNAITKTISPEPQVKQELVKHDVVPQTKEVSSELLVELYRKGYTPVSKDAPLFSKDGKRWTWYMDLKDAMVTNKFLTPIADTFVKMTEDLGIDLVAGMGFGCAGLVGAMVGKSDKLDGIIIREKAKTYGDRKQVHASDTEGNICIVDDIINSGNSAMNTVRALRRSGMEPKYLFSVFEYGNNNRGRNRLEAEGIQVMSLAKLIVQKD